MDVVFKGMRLLMVGMYDAYGISTLIFVFLLVVANLGSLGFVKKHRSARWAFYFFLMSSTLMSNMVYELGEVSRVLGLAHLLFFTPMTIYFALNLKKIGCKNNFGKWVHIYVTMNVITLVIDLSDLFRFFLAE